MVSGFNIIQIFTSSVLKRCGADLTRENVMKQAANLKDVELPLFLPRRQDHHQHDGLLSDREPAVAAVRRQRWSPFGIVIDGHMEN